MSQKTNEELNQRRSEVISGGVASVTTNFIESAEGAILRDVEGREYIEAPRWADIGIVFCVLVFFYNVAATFMKGRWSGISGVLVLDLVALAGLYVAGMYFTPNISVDQHWWWWVIHLWVEATWEVLVGCIMAWGLMKTLGARRKIVTTWLYVEVALMFGSGILGLAWSLFVMVFMGIDEGM